jgi:hypothetical protein
MLDAKIVAQEQLSHVAEKEVGLVGMKIDHITKCFGTRKLYSVEY